MKKYDIDAEFKKWEIENPSEFAKFANEFLTPKDLEKERFEEGNKSFDVIQKEDEESEKSIDRFAKASIEASNGKNISDPFRFVFNELEGFFRPDIDKEEVIKCIGNTINEIPSRDSEIAANILHFLGEAKDKNLSFKAEILLSVLAKDDTKLIRIAEKYNKERATASVIARRFLKKTDLDLSFSTRKKINSKMDSERAKLDHKLKKEDKRIAALIRQNKKEDE